MHNIKDIRNNLNEFKKLIQEKDNLENQKKDISKKKDESLFKNLKKFQLELTL